MTGRTPELTVTRPGGAGATDREDRYPTATDHVVTADGHPLVLRDGDPTRPATYAPGRRTRARWTEEVS